MSIERSGRGSDLLATPSVAQGEAGSASDAAHSTRLGEIGWFSEQWRRAVTLASLLLIAVGGLYLSLWLIYPRLAGTQQLADGQTGPVQLPWQFWGVTRNNNLYVDLSVNWFTPRVWTIVPDDHLAALWVNGQSVPLSGIPANALNDWRNGFSINLGPWLHGGHNVLQFSVDNYGGMGALVLRARPGWQLLLLYGAMLPWLLLLTQLFRLARPQVLVLCFSLAALTCYWGATPWTSRNYDVKRLGETGHLDYVVRIADTLTLPRPDQGWEFFQPPLYYITGAAVWRWAYSGGVSGPEALQALALLYWLVFLVASAATLRLALPGSPPALILATAAVALWPSGIISSLRIGNDPPFYAAAALAGWWMLRWWRSRRRAHLLAAAGCVALALLCKGSALVLVAAGAALLACHMARTRRRLLAAQDAVLAAAIIAGGVLLGLARNIYYWHKGQLGGWLIANLNTLDANLRVPNDLKAYLPLDIPTFLTSPWVDSRDDATGRNNYWNFLLRSSLSGEFDFPGSLHRGIALFWGAALLALLIVLIVRPRYRLPRLAGLWRNAPLLLLGALWLAASLGLRLRHSYSCDCDFRLMLPALVPFVYICVRQGTWARGLLLAIGASSALFFMAG